uniref:cyclic nucleotide-gated ion channel 1-like isoform X2 n=1 Tax=Fragaria vesca subsp. vesca TaxID=101020 RepID=UPI0005C87EE6|nr:PREDICTED: cyclic nucleotide-gated ion channel 1-like isoform X2 [Fragaria vesca subsp. vesca]
MINQPTADVSIECSPPRNLRGRSDTEDGAGMLQILSQRMLDPSDDERSTFFPIWEDKIFRICCAVAVLVDPLFLYIPVKHEEFACFYWQYELIWPFIGLQSAIDLFYAMDIFVFWQRVRRRRDANRTSVKARIFKWLPIIPRIYMSLPIPQATVLIGRFAYNIDNYIFLVLFYPLQYTLRTYGTFGLIKQRPNIETGIGRWLQAILDFLPFIIASHLFGAFWYYFAVDRELNCWVKAFKDVEFEECQVFYNFYCGDPMYNTTENCYNMRTDEQQQFHPSSFEELSTILKASCPINPANTTKFDFGIYQYALQSDFTMSRNLPRKLLQSFWWGLRNLSSFGSNLNTSLYVLEVCFSILVSVSGLALFLVYLNARIQVSRKRSDHIKLRPRMQMVNLDIDLWLSRNDLSEHKKEIKKLIIKNVQQKVEENKDVDVHDFFSLLPTVKKRHIMSLPRLAALKKVPMFKNMNIRVLNEISKHLELATITKNCYIIREGEPIWNVLFITHGTAVSYKTCNQTLVGGSSSIKCLGKDDFIGEELLDWAFVFASISVLPVSPTTVMSQTKVEAFSISANNLRRVVSKFRLHFSLNSPDLEHSPLEHKAALSLQAAWRATANRSRGWSRLRELLHCSEV